MEKHAYINIEPNNGGIVLNVSDGGLCFHSFDPVPRNGKVRFWFSDNGQRIEADGTLAWTDETQKGGLRFAALPAEAREKIRDWMGHPTTTLAADERSVAAGARPPVFPSPSGSVPDTKVMPFDSGALAGVAPELKVPLRSSGFSRGLVTGLLVSAVVVAAILFRDYRREIGESLIELGERFAAKPKAQTMTVSAASPAVLPAAQVVSTASPTLSTAPPMTPPNAQAAPAARQVVAPAPAPIAAPQPQNIPTRTERPVPEPLVSSVKLQPAKMASAAEITALPTAAGEATPKASATPAAPVISSSGPTMSLSSNGPATGPIIASTSAVPTGPTPVGAPASGSSKLGIAPKLELANQPGIHTEGSDAGNADSTRELYFEVGKFKNVFQARDETDKLAQLGFPVTAVEKGHLWANSFHVLVGPYGDEEQAKATHENLVTSGFKPRPFEKGWRNFTLLSSVTLNGARTPEGDYIISWESYIGDASVKFLRNNSVIASAGGRWVKREVKYPRDAYVYRRNADGSRTLLEIHFGGMRQALVFGKG